MGLLGCAKRPRESDMSDEWTTVARPGLMRASDWFTLVTEGQRKVEICMKYVISCAEKKSMKSSSREHVKKEAERTRGSASKKIQQSSDLFAELYQNDSERVSRPWMEVMQALHRVLDKELSRASHLRHAFKLVNRNTFFTTELLSCIRHVDESINIFLVDSAEHHREQAELQRTPSADLATTRGHQATTEIAPSTPTLATSPSALRYGFASVTQGTASKPALPPRATDNPLTQLNARRFPRHSRSASGMWDRERDRLWERVEVGDPDALVEMALLLLTSGGTRDPKKDALDLLERAAAKGSAEAMYKISLLLFEDDRDPKRAVEWLVRASEADCIDATVDLAYLKEHGGPGTEKDEAEAERLYEKACEANHPVALNNLAVMVVEDRAPGMRQRPREEQEVVVSELLKRAKAKRESAAILQNIGVCAEDGFGECAELFDALECYGKAGELGLAAGFSNAGIMLANDGDCARAKDMLEAALGCNRDEKRGEVVGDALYTLAYMGECGSVEESGGEGEPETLHGEILGLYDHAASAGDHRAMTRLAKHCMKAGERERAVALLESACIQGNAEAILMLGELCLRRSDMVEAPTGFSKSPGKLEALGWQLMELAARMGSVDAVERMTAVGNTIRCN